MRDEGARKHHVLLRGCALQSWQVTGKSLLR